MLSAKKGMNRDLKLLFFFHFAKGKNLLGWSVKTIKFLFFSNIFFFSNIKRLKFPNRWQMWKRTVWIRDMDSNAANGHK